MNAIALPKLVVTSVIIGLLFIACQQPPPTPTSTPVTGPTATPTVIPTLSPAPTRTPSSAPVPTLMSTSTPTPSPTPVLRPTPTSTLTPIPTPDGQVKWKFPLEVNKLSSPAIGTDGTIYIGTTGGIHNDTTTYGKNALYAINPDGTLRWKFPTGTLMFRGGVAIGADGTLYFVVGEDFDRPAFWEGKGIGHLYAVSPEGTLKWRYDDIGAWRGANTEVTPAIGDDGTIYVIGKRHLFAIAPNGRLKWRHVFFEPNEQGLPLKGKGIPISSPVVGSDGTIYVNTEKVGMVESGLLAFNADGTLKWHFPGWGGLSAPALGADGTIYVGFGRYAGPGEDPEVAARDQNLYALNPDGTQKWSFNTSHWVVVNPTIAPDGTIYAGTRHDPFLRAGYFFAINPNGTLKWKFDISLDDDSPEAARQAGGTDVYTSAAVGADGTLYFASKLGFFYAFYPNGDLKWKMRENSGARDVPIKFGGSVLSSPALASDGTLYYGLYALEQPLGQGLLAIQTQSRGLADSPWPKFRRNNQNTGR